MPFTEFGPAADHWTPVSTVSQTRQIAHVLAERSYCRERFSTNGKSLALGTTRNLTGGNHESICPSFSSAFLSRRFCAYVLAWQRI
jgi:hypothetical protein